METQLRAALMDWLRSDREMNGTLNAVEEESPIKASIPWLGIAASASLDWSTKDKEGREVRIALELHLRGDDPNTGAALTSAVQRRIERFPQSQPHFWVATVQFLKSRAEKRSENVRAILLEYRFRLLEI